jgi:hypothetical protein
MKICTAYAMGRASNTIHPSQKSVLRMMASIYEIAPTLYRSRACREAVPHRTMMMGVVRRCDGA